MPLYPPFSWFHQPETMLSLWYISVFCHAINQYRPKLLFFFKKMAGVYIQRLGLWDANDVYLDAREIHMKNSKKMLLESFRKNWKNTRMYILCWYLFVQILT
jgi:hypothetical protein